MDTPNIATQLQDSTALAIAQLEARDTENATLKQERDSALATAEGLQTQIASAQQQIGDTVLSATTPLNQQIADLTQQKVAQAARITELESQVAEAIATLQRQQQGA